MESLSVSSSLISEDNIITEYSHTRTHTTDSDSDSSGTIQNQDQALLGDILREIHKLRKENAEVKIYLTENRRIYTDLLLRLNKKEETIGNLIQDTHDLLNQNRLLYGHSFDSILDGGRQLRDLIKDTKEILQNNLQSPK